MYGEYWPLPAANQHLFFPCLQPAIAARQPELQDGRTLAELGVKADDVQGLQWELTQHEEQQKQQLLQRVEHRQKPRTKAMQQRRADEAMQMQQTAAASSSPLSDVDPPSA
jgi:hypothetical protein